MAAAVGLPVTIKILRDPFVVTSWSSILAGRWLKGGINRRH
jgi:hypothetical protein